MHKTYFTLANTLFSIVIIACTKTGFANANFNITPASGYDWPTFIYSGQTAHAYYTVTNRTQRTRSNYAIRGLPSSVKQNTSNSQFCQNPITLAASASCTLQLDINNTTYSNFALCHAENCTTAAVPLNVTQISGASPIYAYIADQNTTNVYKCTLDACGNFSTCNATPTSNVPTWQPFSLSFATIGNTEYAYVTAPNDGVLRKCLVNQAGNLTNCSIQTFNGNAESLTFATVSGTQYAYVANVGSTRIDRCTLNGDGSFNTCTATPSVGAPAWLAFSITIGTVNGYRHAYVSTASFGPAPIYKCDVNADGTFTNNSCVITPAAGAPAWSPISVTFATFNHTQYAYVAERGGNVYQCTLNNDGTFNACTATPAAGVPAWNPFAIDFQTVNNTLYAYVAGGFSGEVYQCTLNNDGSFNTCTAIPSFGVPWVNPTWITKGLN